MIKKFKSTQMNIKTIKCLQNCITGLLEFQQNIAMVMETIYEDVSNRDYFLETNITKEFIGKQQVKLRKLLETFEDLFKELSKYTIGAKINFNKFMKHANAKSIYDYDILVKIEDKLERFTKFYEYIHIDIVQIGLKLIKMNPQFDTEKYEIGAWMPMNQVIGIMISIMNELIKDELNQIEEHLKIIKKYS